MDTLDQLQYQITHLNIDQMLELVKKSDHRENRRFRMIGPKGSLEGTVIDPYLGLLSRGENGIIIRSVDLCLAFDITYQLIE